MEPKVVLLWQGCPDTVLEDVSVDISAQTQLNHQTVLDVPPGLDLGISTLCDHSYFPK